MHSDGDQTTLRSESFMDLASVLRLTPLVRGTKDPCQGAGESVVSQVRPAGAGQVQGSGHVRTGEGQIGERPRQGVTFYEIREFLLSPEVSSDMGSSVPHPAPHTSKLTHSCRCFQHRCAVSIAMATLSRVL